jgi:beta-glucosidase
MLTLGVSTALTALAAAQINTAIVPVPRLAHEWGGERGSWIGRHEAIVQRARKGGVDLLHIGDSITHGWERSGRGVWDRYYAHRKSVNLGFGGDRTEHVLWRLLHGELEGIAPKVAVMMIGTNNSRANTPEEIAAGITAICLTLRARLPETKILLLAIFPRSERSDARRAVCEDTNRLIAELDDGRWIHFLDIGDRFLAPDGTLPKAIMPDFLHLNAEGYRIWAEAVEPTLSRLLGDTAVR